MNNDRLINEMITYYTGDPRRIQHFLKVYTFAGIIGRGEGLSENELAILETAALTHDIGIKVCEEKYGSCNGKQQELEGPPIAEAMLQKLGYADDVIDRVSYLISHHHTYSNIDGSDYQILVEADFLVNMFEGGFPLMNIESAYNKIFQTETGMRLCRHMFGLDI